jgi:hypothetical protein
MELLISMIILLSYSIIHILNNKVDEFFNLLNIKDKSSLYMQNEFLKSIIVNKNP